MNTVLVIAPHPDDETLGCGGTLLKHKYMNDLVSWLIVTKMGDSSFSKDRIKKRQEEIEQVVQMYNFDNVIQLDYCTTQLDTIPLSSMVSSIGEVLARIKPNIIYLPYQGDAHSDHKAVFDAAVACTKWFRYPSVKKVMVYETLSETDFGLNPDTNGFRPTVYSDIEAYLDKKIEIMKVFESEMGTFPFPRSEESIRALSAVRGTAAGCKAAEAFMLLKEVW
ncbi:PIG-L family deacetylase [Brevibacillus sp. AY1]|uniref:PIG-L deacetylase family protein n=1 Tax=Brevibacillus sp. AY1 TaxID=2807621 RepID=UPI0024579673|nr:PIG-L family deacetylase [Brevibacillus sp. AY1]MDH4618261.1 PIG-L family deacetylase [Brevibacillus sp. AY1]